MESNCHRNCLRVSDRKTALRLPAKGCAETEKKRKIQCEINYGKTLMDLFNFGTVSNSSCIFSFVRDGRMCEQWGVYEKPFICPLTPSPRADLCVAGAAVLAFCVLELHAQCSADDDPDSYGCQMQQAAPSSSTTQSPASPTVLQCRKLRSRDTAGGPLHGCFGQRESFRRRKLH